MIRCLVIGLLAAGLLAGCEAAVKGPSLEVGVPRAKAPPGPAFCPPGQAKKGNC